MPQRAPSNAARWFCSLLLIVIPAQAGIHFDFAFSSLSRPHSARRFVVSLVYGPVEKARGVRVRRGWGEGVDARGCRDRPPCLSMRSQPNGDGDIRYGRPRGVGRSLETALLRVNAVLFVIPAHAGIQGLCFCLFALSFFLIDLRFGIPVCSGFRLSPE